MPGQVVLDTKPGAQPWRPLGSWSYGHGVPRVPGPLALGSLGFPDLRPWLRLQRHLAMVWPRRRHRVALAGGLSWQNIINE